MLDCELIPVTLNNLDVVSELTVKFDFPRSVGWIKRALFNPHVAPCDENARRGYVLKSREDGYVGVLCYSPMKLYLKQRPIIGYSGLLLGVQKKYGEWLMDLFKAVQEDEKGHLAFGNTSCSAHATRVCRLARGDKLGPEECGCFRASHLCLSSLILAVVRKTPMACAQGVLWRLSAPLRFLNWSLRKLFSYSKYNIRQMLGFEAPEFEVFWKTYLSDNEGLVASREPAVLKHLFSDSLRAGKLVLLAAWNGRDIMGYVLLRKYEMFGFCNIFKYKIVDAIAIRDDVECLRDLVKAAKFYALNHSGERVEYIGGNPSLSAWIDCELRRKKTFGYNTTTYFYEGDDGELIDAVTNHKGWFFGPFDGERCLGHGGYVDL